MSKIIQVTLNDDIVKKIDEYAKMIGISRSALCGVYIGQGILGYQKAFEMIEENKEDLLNPIKK